MNWYVLNLFIYFRRSIASYGKRKLRLIKFLDLSFRLVQSRLIIQQQSDT